MGYVPTRVLSTPMLYKISATLTENRQKMFGHCMTDPDISDNLTRYFSELLKFIITITTSLKGCVFVFGLQGEIITTLVIPASAASK